MDKNTTLSSLKELVQKFCEERDWDQFHDPKELAIGISTEANELLEIFRFQTKEQMRKQLSLEGSRAQIKDELADVFFFILRFAQMNDIDLSESLEKKISDNNLKYPVEKARGNNAKYNQR